MINWLSNWAGAIVVAVIIATIIEMLLPEGSSKKYIKVVVGVYILFTIVSPVISKFTGTTLAGTNILDLSEYIEATKEKENINNKLGTSNEQNIKEIYIAGLKKDIKTKVEAKGYEVSNVEVEVENNENYNLKSISITALKQNKVKQEEKDKTEDIKAVNEIKIQISNNEEINKEVKKTNNSKEEIKQLSTSEKNKLKEYLSSVYEIGENNLIIQ